MSEPLMNRDLQNLENALRQLAPAGQLQRDQLMFQAGRASTPRRGWLWPAATAAMTVVTLTLGAALALRPPAQPAEKIVYVTVREEVPAAPPSVEPPETPATPVFTQHPPSEYQQLKRHALRWGVENLPAPQAGAGPQESAAGPGALTTAMTKSLPGQRP